MLECSTASRNYGTSAKCFRFRNRTCLLRALDENDKSAATFGVLLAVSGLEHDLNSFIQPFRRASLHFDQAKI